MADLEKTIQIIFGATDNGLVSAIGTFDSKIKSIAGPVGNFTTSLLKTEAAIAGTAAALVGFSINEAGTFQGSINEIAALFNGTADEADTLGDSIRSFAADSASSIDVINQATFTAISTGTEWTEVTEQLVVAERLAIAGSTDLATATAALSRTMNAYGFEAERSTEVSEALFVAAQQGDTNLTKLGTAFGNLAPTSAAANIALDESLAALSAITVTSGNTERSVTLLRSLFRELASPTKELSEALGGVSLESDGLQAVMQQLLAATGGTQSQMDELFGSSEAVAGALILAKDASGTFNTALDAMEQKAGSVNDAYNNMEADFSKVNQRLANNFRLTLLSIGDGLLDEYTDIGQALTSIFQSVGVSLDEGQLGTITDAIEVFAGEIAATIDGIASALPEALEQLDFADLMASFRVLVQDFEGIFDTVFGEGLDLSKPEDLAEALQVAINLVTTFVEITSGILEQFQPIFEAIGEAGQQLSGTDQELNNTIGKVLGAVTILSEFGTALGTFLLVLNQSKADMSSVFDVLIGGVTVVINTVQTLFDLFVLSINESILLIAQGFNALSFGAIPGLEKTVADLESFNNAVGQNAASNFSDLTDGLNRIGGAFASTSEDAKKLNDATTSTSNIIDDLSKKAAGSVSNLDAYNQAVLSGATEAELSAASVAVFGGAVEDTSNQIVSTTSSISSFEAAFGGVNVPIKSTTTELSKLSKEQETAAKRAIELELGLAKLASNEKIANIEFNAQIQTAKIEADSEKIVAAFDSIAFAVGSTNTLIGELFSQDAPDWDVFGVQTRIAVLEAQKQAKALNEAQVLLITAQAESIQEQTRLLSEGGSTITINADDLAPELQQVLKSLIDNIRIESVNNGLEFIA